MKTVLSRNKKSDDISGAKLKAYVVVSAIGVAVILVADSMYMMLNKGLARIKMMGSL